MKITSVKGENFGSFKQVEFSLEDRGLVCIEGENKDGGGADSNGSGKSTLMDLIQWTLFGETTKGVGGDNVIKRDAGKGKALGVVRLMDEHEPWLITRTRAKGKETLRIERYPTNGNAWVDHTQGVPKLNQALIEKVLGCTLPVFRAAVCIGQEDIPDLPAMTDKKLKEIVEKAAGVDVLEEAYQAINARTQAAISKQRNAIAAQQLAENTAKLKQQGLAFAVTQVQDWDRTYEQAIFNHQKITSELTDKINAFDQRLMEQRAQTLEEIKQKVDAKITGLANEQMIEQQLVATEATCRAELTAKFHALTEAEKRDIAAGNELAAVLSKVGTPCTECGTPLEHSHIAALEQRARTRSDAAAQAVNDTRTQVEAAREMLEQASDALATHRAQMTDISKLMAARVKIANEIGASKVQDKELKDLTGKLEALKESYNELIKSSNPYSARWAQLGIEYHQAMSHVADSAKAVEEATKALAEHHVAQEVLGPKGVRAHMLDEVTPYLNTRTAEYLTTLSDGDIIAEWSTLTANAKGELRERFAIDVQIIEGKKVPGGGTFVDLSGGEKRKVRIACALALQDLGASRATKPIELWTADEIDTALDAAGLERLMMVLQEKAQERGTVLVISHQSLRDWIPQVWTVTKENGESTLQQ